jgi:hypothetical protein
VCIITNIDKHNGAREMTNSTKQRIIEAIQECDRYIANEGARADDLRPTEIQDRLDWYKELRAKLTKRLEAA